MTIDKTHNLRIADSKTEDTISLIMEAKNDPIDNVSQMV